MFIDDLAGQLTHILVAHTAIVWPLRDTRIPVFRETERAPTLIKKVFLLETNPQVRVVLDRGPPIRGMRSAIRMQRLRSERYRRPCGLHQGTGPRALVHSPSSCPRPALWNCHQTPSWVYRRQGIGGCSNCLSRLFPRKPGTGCLPSSQMYSSLYFAIFLSVRLGESSPIESRLWRMRRSVGNAFQADWPSVLFMDSMGEADIAPRVGLAGRL